MSIRVVSLEVSRHWLITISREAHLGSYFRVKYKKFIQVVNEKIVGHILLQDLGRIN